MREIILYGINYYDILENIRIYDDKDKEYDFDILCEKKKESFQIENKIVKNKIIIIFYEVFEYKNIFHNPPEYNVNNFYVKGVGYTFISDVRKRLLKYI